MTEIVCKTEPNLVICDEPEDIFDTNKGNHSNKYYAVDGDTFNTVLIPEIKDELENSDYDEIGEIDPLCDSSCNSEIRYCDEPCDEGKIEAHKPRPSTKTISCPVCLKQFVRQNNFDKHIRLHTDEQLQSEQFFKKENTNLDEPALPKSQHQSKRKIQSDVYVDKQNDQQMNNEFYVQNDVEENTESSVQTDRNEMELHPNEVQQHEFFTEDFVQNDDLNTNLRTTCTREKSFLCKFCAKKFINQSKLNVHEKTHTGEKSYSCKLCTKTFSRKAVCVIHMRTHTGENPFSCNVCDKQFSEMQRLNIHMRTHTGEKPYSCKFCEQRFSQKSTCDRHMTTHTGEKPFTCTFCAKQFSHQQILSRHVRTHTGETPFSCEFCTKKFSRKSSCDTHTRTHTGEKPFNCRFCARRFADKSSFFRHVRRAHTTENPFDD